MLHCTRHLFIRQQTSVINAFRAHLAEFGIVAPVGRNGVEELLDVVADTNDKRLPELARACLGALGAQLRMLKAQILNFDRMITAWHRSNETSKRLESFPVLGLHWPQALSPALLIRRFSDQDETSRLGSDWYRSRTRAVVSKARQHQ
jgi:transposase